MDGIVAIHKPAQMTSHDVVARTRRITGERSSGHTGTLDPDATGLLVVCMGKATRLTRFMEDFPKTYEAEIVFGVSTSTGDASGQVVAESADFSIPRSEVFAACSKFVGDIQQVPPMVSALRRGGRRLYELAREGITVERDPRTVSVYRIEPLSVPSWPSHLERGSRGRIRVECSRGTYVRTLCEDICRRLGIAGHLGALVRTATSGFTLDQAVTLDELEQMAAFGSLAQVIKPPLVGVRHLPALDLDELEAGRVSHGTAFECDASRVRNAAATVAGNVTYISLVRPDGSLAAIARARRGDVGLLIQPKVVL